MLPVRHVGITLRESLSATHNSWEAMLYDAADDKLHFAPTGADGSYRPYPIKSIVDQVGGGDAFAGGLISATTRTHTVPIPGCQSSTGPRSDLT